jgi:four helix bundle protein
VDKRELQDRTKAFALRVLKVVEALPKTTTGQAVARQIVRSGTAVGANYRSVCRSRSDAEFVARMGVVEEEADETAYWLELIVEARLLKATLVEPLLREANELTAIMSASRISASKRKQNGCRSNVESSANKQRPSAK